MFKGYRYKHVDSSSYLCVIWLGKSLIFIKDLRVKINSETWNTGEIQLRTNHVHGLWPDDQVFILQTHFEWTENVKGTWYCHHLMSSPVFSIPTSLLIRELLPKVLLSRGNPKHLQTAW